MREIYYEASPRINKLNMITCQGKTRLPMLAREICANPERKLEILFSALDVSTDVQTRHL